MFTKSPKEGCSTSTCCAVGTAPDVSIDRPTHEEQLPSFDVFSWLCSHVTAAWVENLWCRTATKEYAQDGIDWTKVDFEDNQDCLNLFEKRPLGLLSLLDEESTFPKATDLTFANKLKQHLSANFSFKGERGGAFSVCHYAGQRS